MQKFATLSQKEFASDITPVPKKPKAATAIKPKPHPKK
jgi:hypothetical protein